MSTNFLKLSNETGNRNQTTAYKIRQLLSEGVETGEPANTNSSSKQHGHGLKLNMTLALANKNSTYRRSGVKHNRTDKTGDTKRRQNENSEQFKSSSQIRRKKEHKVIVFATDIVII